MPLLIGFLAGLFPATPWVTSSPFCISLSLRKWEVCSFCCICTVSVRNMCQLCKQGCHLSPPLTAVLKWLKFMALHMLYSNCSTSISLVDITVIHELKEMVGGESLLQFVTPEYMAQAEAVYHGIGVQELSINNIWFVFEQMLCSLSTWMYLDFLVVNIGLCVEEPPGWQIGHIGQVTCQIFSVHGCNLSSPLWPMAVCSFCGISFYHLEEGSKCSSY